jgi:hypothetical protein
VREGRLGGAAAAVLGAGGGLRAAGIGRAGKTGSLGRAGGLKGRESGRWNHPDLLLSAALVGVLDGLEWGVSGEVVVIRREDPLAEMGEGF